MLPSSSLEKGGYFPRKLEFSSELVPPPSERLGDGSKVGRVPMS